MANKNTKLRNRLMRSTRRSGETSLTIKIPVGNYHSCPGSISSALRPQTYNVSIRNKKTGVVSQNLRRNMQEVAYVWDQEDGSNTKGCKTQHEVIDRRKSSYPLPRKGQRNASTRVQLPEHEINLQQAVMNGAKLEKDAYQDKASDEVIKTLNKNKK